MNDHCNLWYPPEQDFEKYHANVWYAASTGPDLSQYEAEFNAREKDMWVITMQMIYGVLCYSSSQCRNWNITYTYMTLYNPYLSVVSETILQNYENMFLLFVAARSENDRSGQ